MFGWWGRFVVRTRWLVLAATLVLVAVGGVWGTGVFGALSGGGFEDPASPSSIAATKITDELGRQGADVVALYRSDSATVDEPGLRGPVTAVLQELSGRPEVSRVLSFYTTGAPTLVSTDRHATYLAIQLRDGSNDSKTADLETLRPLLAAGGGVDTKVGGTYAFQSDASSQIEKDIVRAELISMPILLVLLVLIFRGLIAAATPLLVGVLAILGAFSVTRLLTQVTDVSVFAANVITMIGLGMAIDYALFIVSRFREELAAGHSTADAIARTVATAGRTVVVSALTVALALSSLLIFPMGFLKSMGYGGMAAVLVAMLAALTALPALLAVLGPRINALRIPLPQRRRSADSFGGWARLANAVMRRPVYFVVGVTALLLAVGTPFLRAEFGGFDERVLPAGTESRVVTEQLSADFPGGSVAPIAVLVDGASVSTAQAFAGTLAALPGATGSAITAAKGNATLISVSYAGESSSQDARALVRDIRATPPPAGAHVYVAGRPAFDLDLIDSLTGRLGWMALYVGVVTFVLLFFAFGSVVLPLKAIVMNVISLGASFGVIVWIFQDGHLANLLGFTATGFLEPTNLILMLAILFGLSTDYEVFLLSRIREEWDQVPDNTRAVSNGLQRTGGIITAAALLLIIVVSGFATGSAATIKMLGIGTLVAVAADATLVRSLLVPATMRLLGRWNWWAPGPLARVYRHYGLRESAEPTAPASRHTFAPVED